MVGQIYPTELQINKANSFDTEVPFLDLELSITNGIVIPPPQTLFVVGILFSRYPSVCACFRPSVTFCFLNILKSHRCIFIKPCKHVHICKTNT